MATSSSLFLATIYNQSQLAERKQVAHYWLINTVATAVPLSAHPSPLVITTKLAAAILGGGCSEEVFCRPGTAPVRYTGAKFHQNRSTFLEDDETVWRVFISTITQLFGRRFRDDTREHTS